MMAGETLKYGPTDAGRWVVLCLIDREVPVDLRHLAASFTKVSVSVFRHFHHDVALGPGRSVADEVEALEALGFVARVDGRWVVRQHVREELQLLKARVPELAEAERVLTEDAG